ncbi:PTS glucose transporter subunit IIA [Lactobacillus sp. LL6]|uniref:PTS sugar transporter subunit IIA n=1 Tax=Lactobacillus sp. LL6 TaxID=2596827 RepID=UPI001184C7F8|nr:PTS glucose transporter subunit IIA [Lactobacillus sp. LL6]TSO26662.1 PTS glucose transporter subunit IIA [Lactobacillus sp. LL6]
MFNFFKKKNKGVEIAAAVNGNSMPITDVKDDVFSTKMLGDGYAIKPSDGEIVAPIDGEITTLFPTKHAIGITTDKGLEILIHLGLDTVELKGEPFKVKVQKGDKVKKGDSLAQMDLASITDKGYDNTVIVVYTNMDILSSVSTIEPKTVTRGEDIQVIEYK